MENKQKTKAKNDQAEKEEKEEKKKRKPRNGIEEITKSDVDHFT